MAKINIEKMAKLRTALVVGGDLSGGFHLLKLEVWKDMAKTICEEMKLPEAYYEKACQELEDADRRRKELQAQP